VCGAVEDPEAFRPERWINGKGGEASVMEGLWQFGGGGRVCIGYKVAQMELFVAVARSVAGFDFVAVSFSSSLSFFLPFFRVSVGFVAV